MHKYTKKELRDLIEGKLRRNFGLKSSEANKFHMFKSCAMVLRDIMSANRIAVRKTTDQEERQVHYLSLEFLMGRSLEKNAFNMELLEPLKGAVADLGFNLSDLFEVEPDAGLGNGGLGRLAACYLEAMTTLEIPATGYSICYELGIFKQKIVDGEQLELPDNWLEVGDSWLLTKQAEVEEVRFGGTVEGYWEDGVHKIHQKDFTSVLAVPRDMAIAGYKTEHVNLLRLWEAKAPIAADTMNYYSSGEYLKAVEQKTMAEVISKVLYPADNHYEGKSLRLKQQYFFVSATVQNIMRKHKNQYGTLRNFHEKHVIQINDTHPTLVIPEMMRILLDEEGYSWEEAWHITTQTVAYTNHTVLAEALERWPQSLVESLLPRIFQILCEINDRYLTRLREFFHDDMNKLREMAVVWDGEVRMANLCVAACFAVNGVSALHSDILVKDVFHSAWQRTPNKFKNVTNGIDHRRWLGEANPELNKLICDLNGSDSYLIHPEDMEKIEKFRDDAPTLQRLGEIKKHNKEAFASYVAKEYGFQLNTDAIFDVQVKRLHEYKRQLLNVLHIVYLYQQLKSNPNMDMAPRTFLFGAKAAPSYYVAKQIISLINSLSTAVNNDPACKDKLQVFFLENYRVSLAERLMPASELSEQISTAGKEASGTGNMKFMMNGALTIGTMDGANVEMFDRVGEDNIFIFGLTAREVEEKKRQGYNSYEYFNHNPILQSVLNQISAGFGDGRTYQELTNRLLFGQGGPADEYMLLADFESYRYKQGLVSEAYLDQKHWNQMALTNIARSSIFSADRSIADYANTIWHVPYRK
ncbi:MAG: glycogen/starch/alpha-glucan phosphorylase [Oscillospiraceae bacterium]|nr:glycogen/starch/alpha-glucan phosphorylase [Oscillospiraceae bacterium]